MSRKNYVETAEIIKAALDTAARRNADPQPVYDVARDLASMFARDNGSFDRQRFLAAAGVQN
jgi:hypothetical protein